MLAVGPSVCRWFLLAMLVICPDQVMLEHISLNYHKHGCNHCDDEEGLDDDGVLRLRKLFDPTM